MAGWVVGKLESNAKLNSKLRLKLKLELSLAKEIFDGENVRVAILSSDSIIAFIPPSFRFWLHITYSSNTRVCFKICCGSIANPHSHDCAPLKVKIIAALVMRRYN